MTSYDVTVTSTYKAGIVVPIPPVPIHIPGLPAREWPAGTSKVIRWRCDAPFMFIPEASGDWQKGNWPAYRVVPPNSRDWFAAYSAPYVVGGVQQGHYLDLATRAFSTCPIPGKTPCSVPDKAQYNLFPLQGDAWRLLSRSFKGQGPANARLLKKLLGTILSSWAVRATIIIAQ